MIIKRKGEELGLSAEVVEIELTPYEMEQVYKIKENEYRQEEAKQVLYDAYESGQLDIESYENYKNDTAFYEKMLDEYDKRFSSEISENAIWEKALNAALAWKRYCQCSIDLSFPIFL